MPACSSIDYPDQRRTIETFWFDVIAWTVRRPRDAPRQIQADVNLLSSRAASRCFPLISPSASSQWQPALLRISEHTLRVCIPAGVSHPDERYPSSAPPLCEAFGGTSRQTRRLLFYQLRLLLWGLIGYLRRALSPRCHRYRRGWKRRRRRRRKPTQGHLCWIHPPLELVTEPPLPTPIPDPFPPRMRKCVFATLSDTCCGYYTAVARQEDYSLFVLFFKLKSKNDLHSRANDFFRPPSNIPDCRMSG